MNLGREARRIFLLVDVEYAEQDASYSDAQELARMFRR